MKRKAEENVRENITPKSWLEISTLPRDLHVDGKLFEELWELRPAVVSKIMMYGKLIDTPRLQQSYMRNYIFSGVEAIAVPLPEILKPYLEWANDQDYGEFNQCLVNWYHDGSQYIGSHADDEKQLVKDSPIVTITFCQPAQGEKVVVPRTFRLRKDKKMVKDIATHNNTVIVMGGAFQSELKHEIVKIAGKKAPKVGPRISLTMRQFS